MLNSCMCYDYDLYYVYHLGGGKQDHTDLYNIFELFVYKERVFCTKHDIRVSGVH